MVHTKSKQLEENPDPWDEGRNGVGALRETFVTLRALLDPFNEDGTSRVALFDSLTLSDEGVTLAVAAETEAKRVVTAMQEMWKGIERFPALGEALISIYEPTIVIRGAISAALREADEVDPERSFATSPMGLMVSARQMLRDLWSRLNDDLEQWYRKAKEDSDA